MANEFEEGGKATSQRAVSTPADGTLDRLDRAKSLLRGLSWADKTLAATRAPRGEGDAAVLEALVIAEPTIRKVVAANPECPPALLDELARSRYPEVRLALANNPSIGAEAGVVLAADSREDVRMAFAATREGWSSHRRLEHAAAVEAAREREERRRVMASENEGVEAAPESEVVGLDGKPVDGRSEARSDDAPAELFGEARGEGRPDDVSEADEAPRLWSFDGTSASGETTRVTMDDSSGLRVMGEGEERLERAPFSELSEVVATLALKVGAMSEELAAGRLPDLTDLRREAAVAAGAMSKAVGARVPDEHLDAAMRLAGRLAETRPGAEGFQIALSEASRNALGGWSRPVELIDLGARSRDLLVSLDDLRIAFGKSAVVVGSEHRVGDVGVSDRRAADERAWGGDADAQGDGFARGDGVAHEVIHDRERHGQAPWVNFSDPAWKREETALLALSRSASGPALARGLATLAADLLESEARAAGRDAGSRAMPELIDVDDIRAANPTMPFADVLELQSVLQSEADAKARGKAIGYALPLGREVVLSGALRFRGPSEAAEPLAKMAELLARDAADGTNPRPRTNGELAAALRDRARRGESLPPSVRLFLDYRLSMVEEARRRAPAAEKQVERALVLTPTKVDAASLRSFVEANVEGRTDGAPVKLLVTNDANHSVLSALADELAARRDKALPGREAAIGALGPDASPEERRAAVEAFERRFPTLLVERSSLGPKSLALAVDLTLAVSDGSKRLFDEAVVAADRAGSRTKVVEPTPSGFVPVSPKALRERLGRASAVIRSERESAPAKALAALGGSRVAFSDGRLVRGTEGREAFVLGDPKRLEARLLPVIGRLTASETRSVRSFVEANGYDGVLWMASPSAPSARPAIGLDPVAVGSELLGAFGDGGIVWRDAPSLDGSGRSSSSELGSVSGRVARELDSVPRGVKAAVIPAVPATQARLGAAVLASGPAIPERLVTSTSRGVRMMDVLSEVAPGSVKSPEGLVVLDPRVGTGRPATEADLSGTVAPAMLLSGALEATRGEASAVRRLDGSISVVARGIETSLGSDRGTGRVAVAVGGDRAGTVVEAAFVRVATESGRGSAETSAALEAAMAEARGALSRESTLRASESVRELAGAVLVGRRLPRDLDPDGLDEGRTLTAADGRVSVASLRDYVEFAREVGGDGPVLVGEAERDLRAAAIDGGWRTLSPAAAELLPRMREAERVFAEARARCGGDGRLMARSLAEVVAERDGLDPARRDGLASDLLGRWRPGREFALAARAALTPEELPAFLRAFPSVGARDASRELAMERTLPPELAATHESIRAMVSATKAPANEGEPAWVRDARAAAGRSPSRVYELCARRAMEDALGRGDADAAFAALRAAALEKRTVGREAERGRDQGR